LSVDVEKDVEQLLKDWRPFWTAFGGAAALDSTLNMESTGGYGPGGMIFAGVAYDKRDVEPLRQSLLALEVAMQLLKREPVVGKHSEGDVIAGLSAWSALLEPYLGDPADPSIVADWRRKAAMGYISARRFLERHDAAIKKLAEYLAPVPLYPVYPKLMSETEESEIENQYAEMYAVFRRIMAAGGTNEAGATAQVAEFFDVWPETVERVVEFRRKAKPDTCSWGGCDRAPFSQDLCMKHYQQRRRAAQRQEEAS
jgi:hypothetical protein